MKPGFIYSANKILSQKGRAASPSWMVAVLRLSQDQGQWGERKWEGPAAALTNQNLDHPDSDSPLWDFCASRDWEIWIYTIIYPGLLVSQTEGCTSIWASTPLLWLMLGNRTTPRYVTLTLATRGQSSGSSWAGPLPGADHGAERCFTHTNSRLAHQGGSCCRQGNIISGWYWDGYPTLNQIWLF